MIQKTLDRFVETGMAAGTSVLVLKDGKEVFFGSAGQLSREAPAAFGRDAIMRMYSMTKVVTAAAIMTLVDQKLISVEDPVSKFIPEYAHLTVAMPDGTLVPADKPLTIRHLLTMTSGIPYPDGSKSAVSQSYAREMAAMNWKEATTLDMARAIARCPLCFHPGDQWLYGLSADVLGAVVVVVTGMELGEYMKKTIFDPLGMEDTAFTVPEDKRHRLATLYNVSPEGVFTARPQEWFDMGRVEMGGAGLYSTVEDFARFGEMLRLGGKGILSEDAVREMSANHLTPQQQETFWETRQGYGYGYLVRTVTDETINTLYREPNGAFGWNGMAGTTLRIDPARGMTIVYGIQRVPADHDDFIPPVLQAIAEAFPS